MSRYFPISLSLAGCECLVVGGGKVALRKARSLAAAGAQVTAVSPAFCPELTELDGVRLVEQAFEEQHAAGATLVFAATSDPEVNRLVARAAREHGALVNVVDTPAECDFIVPSTLVRGALTISVCSGGAAPALSKRIRRELEERFPTAYADFVELLAELRGEVRAREPDIVRRRAIFQELAAERTWRLFAREGPDSVRALAHRLPNEPAG